MFNVLVLLILTNVFVAILNEAYSETVKQFNEAGIDSQAALDNILRQVKKGFERRWSSIFGTQPTPSKTELQKALDDADVNKDGVIDQKEMEDVAKKLNLDETAAVTLMQQFDENKNQVLEKNEVQNFSNFITQLSQPKSPRQVLQLTDRDGQKFDYEFDEKKYEEYVLHSIPEATKHATRELVEKAMPADFQERVAVLQSSLDMMGRIQKVYLLKLQRTLEEMLH
eukprot:TRINITY_DN842_c0_g1_i19.p1 TRINITY_DN842_c0_g1~~TRINITY_DN842_c0_g1_i19.p1  ORF type:complete len:226 (-),score=72.21 TRINITY_DN842_c0_g1_i19:70-747(-)